VIDITGDKYGSLTAIREVGRDKSNNRRYLCICDCGEAKIIRLTHIRSGASTSCGCVARKVHADRLRTHGMRKFKFYGTWKAMLLRCNNPKDAGYANYGGRGVTVCEEWLDPLKFYADMGEPPEGTSLERKDVNLGYNKDNCVWADSSTQGANKRKSSKNTSGFIGVLKRRDRWASVVQFRSGRYWLGTFNTPEEASTWRDAYIIANGWPHRLNYVEVLESGTL